METAVQEEPAPQVETFAGEVRKAVEAARAEEQAILDEEAQKRQRAEDVRAARRAKARDLVEEVRAIFQEAADASDGALELTTAAETTTCRHELRWSAPAPERTLKLTLDWDEGYAIAAWAFTGTARPSSTLNPSTVDDAHIKNLVRQLTSQAAWKPRQ